MRPEWKSEVSPPESDGETPDADVGPAWIYPPDGSENPVRDGDWSARADAQRLAAEDGYALPLDDGFGSELGR